MSQVQRHRLHLGGCISSQLRGCGQPCSPVASCCAHHWMVDLSPNPCLIAWQERSDFEPALGQGPGQKPGLNRWTLLQQAQLCASAIACAAATAK